MRSKRVSVRLEVAQLRRAKKLLAARTTSETIQIALDLVTEKLAHDAVLQRFSGVGSSTSFKRSDAN